MTNKKKKVSIKKPSKKKVVVQKSGKGKKKRSSPILPMIGAVAGGYLGGPTGAALGASAGRWISRITGMGAYKVNHNSIVQGHSVPTFSQGGDGVRICHREFITDVVGSTTFTLNSYFINPGLSSTFPLLSCLADCYETCEWDGLVFEYRPTSGTAVSAASSALGVVIMATDYDVLNSDFLNKQQMESYEYATSTVPFQECIHPVECAPGQNVLRAFYVREGPTLPSGADQRLYDIGKFQIATQGMQSVYTVGELWVSYDVVFRKPRISSTPGFSYVHLQSKPAGTASNATPLGTSGPVATALSSNIGIGPNGTSTTSFLISQKGTYLVIICMQSGAGTALNLAVGGNLSGTPNWFNNNTGGICDAIVSGGNAICARAITCNVNGTGAANTILISSATGVAAANCDIFCFPMIPSNLASPELLSRLPPSRPRRLSIDPDWSSVEVHEGKSP